MTALIAHRDVVVLRPLLHAEAGMLRDFLSASQCPWIEDPSNADRRFERVRVRPLVEQGGGVSRDTLRHAGIVRHREMQDTARQLAEFGGIYPEGFALWREPTMPVDVLAALLRVVGGQTYAPNRAAVARLAGCLRRTALGGVQVTRWQGAWLLTREPAACSPSVALQPGQRWDGRFRVIAMTDPAEPTRLRIGALGPHAAAYRKFSRLPSVILQSLPAVHDYKDIIAVPHLRLGLHCEVVFDPPVPAAPLAFALHHFV